MKFVKSTLPYLGNYLMLDPKEKEKKRQDEINHPVSSDNVNGPASVACQSLIIHHDECCGENSKHRLSSSHLFTDPESTNFFHNFFLCFVFLQGRRFLLR